MLVLSYTHTHTHVHTMLNLTVNSFLSPSGLAFPKLTQEQQQVTLGWFLAPVHVIPTVKTESVAKQLVLPWNSLKVCPKNMHNKNPKT